MSMKGIVQKMREAKTKTEAKQLLDMLKTYRFASGNTVRKVHKLAKEKPIDNSD